MIAAAAVAGAADFGGHVGYFGNDVRKADVGIRAMFPIGPIAISPNIDYTRATGAGLWFGNADVDLRFHSNASTTFWVGAGPTYGYISNYGSSSSANRGYSVPGTVRGQQYAPPPSNPPPSNPPPTNPPPTTPPSNNPPPSNPPSTNPPYTPPGGNPPSGNPVVLPPGAHAFTLMGGSRAWGWDANAGVSFHVASVQPYVMARYNRVHSLRTAGLVVGLQFGH